MSNTAGWRACINCRFRRVWYQPDSLTWYADFCDVCYEAHMRRDRASAPIIPDCLVCGMRLTYWHPEHCGLCDDCLIVDTAEDPPAHDERFADSIIARDMF